MSGLISGKEALIALANGEVLEYTGDDINFGNALDLTVSEILSDLWKLKLKPKTITINGIEVPATFNPKEGEIIWVLSGMHKRGYLRSKYESHFDYCLGAWQSEEEIKQVVTALRSVFNTK